MSHVLIRCPFNFSKPSEKWQPIKCDDTHLSDVLRAVFLNRRDDHQSVPSELVDYLDSVRNLEFKLNSSVYPLDRYSRSLEGDAKKVNKVASANWKFYRPN